MIQNLIFGILLLKMLFPAYNFFIFIHSGHYQSFFFDFRFSGRKSQSQQKLSVKITYFAIQFRSKNLTHFMNLNSLEIENNILPQHNQKPFWLYHKSFSKHASVWWQKKIFALRHFWHPKTAFLKHFESKFLYISVYFCISNYQNFCSKDVVRFCLVVWGWWEAE